MVEVENWGGWDIGLFDVDFIILVGVELLEFER